MRTWVQNRTGNRPHRRMSITANMPPQPIKNMLQLLLRYQLGTWYRPNGRPTLMLDHLLRREWC
jgi:hypothetical protein